MSKSQLIRPTGDRAKDILLPEYEEAFTAYDTYEASQAIAAIRKALLKDLWDDL